MGTVVFALLGVGALWEKIEKGVVSQGCIMIWRLAVGSIDLSSHKISIITSVYVKRFVVTHQSSGYSSFKLLTKE